MDSLLVSKVGSRGRKAVLARLIGQGVLVTLGALIAFSPRSALAQNDDDDDPVDGGAASVVAGLAVALVVSTVATLLATVGVFLLVKRLTGAKGEA